MRMSKIVGKRGKQARTELPVYVKSVDTYDTCGRWSKNYTFLSKHVSFTKVLRRMTAVH